MNHFYFFFNVFTLINLTVLFIILFFRKNNSITNKLLALIVINPGLNFVNNILIQSGVINDVPFALFFFQGTMLFYAPLVMAYITLMLGQKFRFLSALNVITLLVLILDLYYAVEFFGMDSSQQYDYLQGLLSAHSYPEQMNIINGLFVLVMLAYFIVALVKIRRHKRAVQGFYSDMEKVKVNYVNHFAILLTILNISLSTAYLAFPTPSVEFFYIPFFINIIYIYIVFYAFKHSAILSKPEYCNLVDNASSLSGFMERQDPLCREIEEIKQAQKSGNSRYKLTELEIEDNYQKILSFFAEQKPYLDPNLNLTKLSSNLNACSHNISLTINTKFNKTFFDLVNTYRVEEAKALLQSLENNNLTIEAVGFESGFNSKTAFYRAFKKHLQQTPSEYLQKIKEGKYSQAMQN